MVVKPVKFLGLHVDSLLDFNAHIADIGYMAGRKLNILAKFSKTLSTESKINGFLFHFYVSV